MYEAVVIGVSAGGMAALKTILPRLPADFPLPLAIVQHLGDAESHLAELLDRHCAIAVKEAEAKERFVPGTAYLAPAGYHLLIEPDGTFGLSVDARVNFCCPAIDVLFESAADVYADRLVGIVLTGANADGAKGLKAIKARRGLAVVQDPAEAEAPFMPQAAIDAARPHVVATLDGIAQLLVELGRPEGGVQSHVA
jgi:two-component system chemotaxis response regulator CheB